MKPETHMNETKVEVESHKNTNTRISMGSLEKKQNHGNEDAHIHKSGHVKAEVVHYAQRRSKRKR